MSISAGSPSRSVRTAKRDWENMLIVVGESHKTGEETDTEKHYRNLEDLARERFGATEFENSWSTQDYFSLTTCPSSARRARAPSTSTWPPRSGRGG